MFRWMHYINAGIFTSRLDTALLYCRPDHRNIKWRRLITVVPGTGKRKETVFSNIECHHFGTVDAGLLAIEGKLVKGVKMEDAEDAIAIELEKLKTEKISEAELQKVKNKTESALLLKT